VSGRALRVLMYAPQFHPIRGGYERAAERVAAELARRGHAVEVVTERRERAWAPRDRVSGVAVRRLPVLFRPGVHAASAGAALAAWLLPNLRRFDVLHAHTFGPQTSVAIAVARLLRVPVVLKLPSTGEGGIAAILAGGGPARAAIRGLHRGVAACLALSRALRDEAVAFGFPAERVHLLPNGIDADAFRPASPAEREAARRALGVGPGPVVLRVARLASDKAPLTLLRAWESVAAARPEARLVYVGHGPEREALDAAVAASSAHGAVRVEGFVDDPRPWYAAADLLVISSDYEGHPNAMLEAMSAGLPLVATRVSGTEDAFAEGDLGEMVEPGNAGALAAAMLRMLDDPARREACGRAAREVALQRYALPQVVDELERIYAAAGERKG
jgi:glycosyltransferase involved in cell wall biosynthesis